MDNEGFDLLNNVPCSIFSFTGNGIISYVNDALLQQLQYVSDELLGQHVEKILTLPSRIFCQTHFFPLLQLQQDVTEIFLTLKSKNNTSVPVLINATQKKYHSDMVNVCACIAVHQRKKYEDEILEAKKIAEEALQKNELLQKTQHELETGKQELDKQLTKLKYTNEELLQLNEIVTHDLQEPLRKIRMYTDIIEKNKVNVYDEKTIKSLHIINKSVSRIRSLLQKLQNYLPILTQPINKVKVDLNALVSAQLSVVLSQHPGVEVDVEVENLPVIEGDIAQLEILFHELFTNSVEFRNTDHILHIRIAASLIDENVYYSTEGKYQYVSFVKITVADNGMGFNPVYKDHVFKILKRLDFTRKGLGFGLAFCKRIAENHMGFIKATAEEGKGAKIIVSLPLG